MKSSYCGARALKTAVTDPNWRTNPYVIEEAA